MLNVVILTVVLVRCLKVLFDIFGNFSPSAYHFEPQVVHWTRLWTVATNGFVFAVLIIRECVLATVLTVWTRRYHLQRQVLQRDISGFEKNCLQVGQLETVGLHVLQMLWPPRQRAIGGTMYCLQAGHYSSVGTLLPLSDTAVCMLDVTTLSFTRLKNGDIYLKHNSLINTISRLPFFTPTHRCFSLAYVLLISS